MHAAWGKGTWARSPCIQGACLAPEFTCIVIHTHTHTHAPCPADNPGLGFGETSKEVSAGWKALSEEERAPYKVRVGAARASRMQQEHGQEHA